MLSWVMKLVLLILSLGIGQLSLTVLNASAAPITVFSDFTAFSAATGATDLAIPASQTAFPGSSCGTGDIGPTGIGGQVDIGFNSNMVAVTNVSGGQLALCIFDNGTIIKPFGNTIPDVMIANTIVGNGEDDFLLVFDTPVEAVGFRFLTNSVADELLTFRDSSGNVISVVDIDPFTPTNTRVFAGFHSVIPIKSLVIDTVGGAVQNEGFDALYVATTAAPIPEPSTILLLGTGLAALAASRYQKGCESLDLNYQHRLE